MKKKFSSMWRVAIALVMVLSLNLVMAAPVSAATLASVTATPANNMTGATTTYTIGFTTATTWGIASVEMEFATGFDVSGATLSGTPTGISAGTVSSSGQVVTYTVTAPVVISSSTAISIALSGIVNPAAATYDPGVTVRTKDGTSATIDDGIDAVTIVPAPVSFKVEDSGGGAITATAGTAFDVKITALETDGTTTETGYIGDHLIYFSSTATGSPTIPAFILLNFSAGIVTTSASFILTNAGETPTITATDTALSVSGTSAAITVGPAAAHHLTITGAPASVTAGVAFSGDVTVTAYDAYGNVRTGETEVVNWTSSDGTATQGSGLPADSQALVAGTYTFSGSDFTLKTVGEGTQDITATGQTSSLSAPATVTVNPAAASTLTAAADPVSIAADGVASSNITATAKDEFTNIDTNYTASVTFATSLGTLSNVDANFVSGVAEATLTSTTTGTTTVMVSSGTMDDTLTVTLTVAPTEVWVDDTGNDSNPGTEALPFLTIAKGITIAGADGTVNVLPGTYIITSTLTIGTAGLTLQSTGTAAETTIDAETNSVTPAISITGDGDDVVVDGFTILSGSALKAISVLGSDGAVVRNNTITISGTEGIGISPEGGATDTTISGNTLNNAVIYLAPSSGNLVSGNDSSTIVIETSSSDNDIIGNTLTDIDAHGIKFVAEGTHNDTLIQGNTISRNLSYGIRVEFDTSVTVTNLTITGNTITDNGIAGIYLDNASITWGVGNTINNNNISGNLDLGINNASGEVIDAESNWWGDDTGPLHASTNPDATGDEVSGDVDYRPWLTAAYSEPGAPVTSIELKTGWNLISLMLIPDDSAIETVLTGVTVDSVWNYTAATWSSYIPSAPDDLVTMVDGKGYWVEMSAAATLTIQGVELPAPPATPPTYDVVVGWNFIGFKSTTAKTANTYLAAIAGEYTIIYAFDAVSQAYVTVLSSDNFEPGKGYWIAITATGTIYP